MNFELTYPEWCFWMAVAFFAIAAILQICRVCNEYEYDQDDDEYHYIGSLKKDSELQ
jgi:hypothetical protein